MKYVFTLVLLIALVACKQKVLSGVDLQNKLVSTMQDFLDKTPQPGTTFKVKDVIYYTDVKKKSYDCEFQVNMHSDNKDTVGTMMAIISNDFKKVDRRH